MGWVTPTGPSNDWTTTFAKIVADQRVAHVVVRPLPHRGELVLLVVLRHTPVNRPRVFRGERDGVMRQAVEWLAAAQHARSA